MKRILLFCIIFFVSACQAHIINPPVYPYDDSREKGYSTYYPPFLYKDSSVVIKAAEEGSRNAQFDLGVMYRNGYGIKQDDKKAVEWWTKAAEQGHPRAQLYLGRMYDQGYGVNEDHEIAKSWYIKAGENGDAYGQYYFHPCKSLESAARQGVLKAQYELGTRYQKGFGSCKYEKDHKLAAYWLEKAAEQGDTGAASVLGFMYYRGEHGLEKNNLEAYVWLFFSGRNALTLSTLVADKNSEPAVCVGSRDGSIACQAMHTPSAPKHIESLSDSTVNTDRQEKIRKTAKPETREDIISSIFSNFTEFEVQQVNSRIAQIDEKIKQSDCRKKEDWAVFYAKTPAGRCSVGEDL